MFLWKALLRVSRDQDLFSFIVINFLLTICPATSGQHTGNVVRRKSKKISLVGGKIGKKEIAEIKAEVHEKDFSFPRNDLISKTENFEMIHKMEKP